MKLSIAVLLLTLQGASASATTANPIRKIVTLMQDMQKELEAEGAKEKEMFDKFMCWCNGGSAELEKSASDAKSKIEELASKIEEEKAEKAQLEQDLKTHESDRAAATDDLSKATALR